jgi:DNA helicase TIP49 (TBP-interacting protein)
MLKWNGGGNSTILNMKNYLILKDTMAAGKKVSAGDIVELDVDTGNQLVGYFKAEETTKKTKDKKTDRSVGLETSEVKAPKTRAKK